MNHRPKTRGDRRVIYVSDPSLIASRYLPDPVSERDLREWIDDVASAGVDLFIQEVFTQGWTTYWRTEEFDFDARLQHRRFLPMLDAGIQPIEVLMSQCRSHGMEVMAGFRMNDNHTDSVRQGVGDGASFIVENPHLRLKDPPAGEAFQRGGLASHPLDYSFEEVRAFVLNVMTTFVKLFPVDGLEMCFRDNRYFPTGEAIERRHLMTDLVKQIRMMLDSTSFANGKRRLLSCRVPSTVEECKNIGLDVGSWVKEGLVDYVSPQDTMYAEANIPYDEWRELTEGTNCRLYPALMNWVSGPSRVRTNAQPISQDIKRALVTSMYAQGADGICLYNHFLIMRWNGGNEGDWTYRGVGAYSPFYPMALHDIHDLRAPQLALRGRRHYVFDPTLGDSTSFGLERSHTGKIKAQRAVLSRPDGCDNYIFRLYEDLDDASASCLIFRAFFLTTEDLIHVTINDKPVPARGLRRRNDEIRNELLPLSVLPGATPGSTQYDSRPFVTYWFPLTAELCIRGENRLGLQLVSAGKGQDVLIEEVDVFIVPKFIE